MTDTDTPADNVSSAGAQENTDPAPQEPVSENSTETQDDGNPTVAQGTYELLRGRLEAAASELATRALQLNDQRLSAFGSSKLELSTTERVRTENNVVPRDVEAVGEQLIMAYTARAGVRSEIRPEDVFSVHHIERREAAGSIEVVVSPNPDGLAGSALDDDRFRSDFQELHTYFKETRVQQVYRRGDKLLIVFRTGRGHTDIRVFRWAIQADGGLQYLDDQGDRDHRFLPSHDVEWVLTTRADHVATKYIQVAGRVFVDPLGGSIDIRIEDGSDDGELLLTESGTHGDQALQDCQVSYSQAGDLVLLRILPYGETEERFYVVNLLIHRAARLDALGAAFRQLPEGHGLIFPEGVYLRTGEIRTFDLDSSDMELLQVVHSPNGEDVLYVFHEADDGRSILLPYNVVRQEISNPIWCHGACLFADGGMVVFREEPEPTRIHPIQLWTTPFCSDEWYADQPRAATSLNRIGNPDLVVGIADSLALTRLVDDVEPTVETYGDLLSSAGRTLDAHHWLGRDEVGDLATPVNEVRLIAEQVIDEFERVQEVRASAAKELSDTEQTLEAALEQRRIKPPQNTEEYIGQLAELRRVIGHLHTLRDRREVDVDRVDELAADSQKAYDKLAQDAAEHLATDDAFTHYHTDLANLATRTEGLNSSVDAASALAQIDEVGEAMELVAGTVSDLVVEDPRVRTTVLEQVSGVLAELNRVRAGIDARHNTLIESETGAAFSTELGLFGQTIATALARVETPEACDDALARLLLQLEQLETSAPRTEGQLDELAQRRDQVTEALTARRQKLVDDRQQRSDRLASTGTRTLERVAERAKSFESIDDINGFFAADPMVVRVRSLVEQLRELGEPVRADELAARMGNGRELAIRALRDRLELFDGDAVKLGMHRFSAEDRTRELTLVPNGDTLDAVLTGTDLRFGLDEHGLDEFKDLWSEPFPSESATLYRATFLAFDLLAAMLVEDETALLSDLATNASRKKQEAAGPELLERVRKALDVRLGEGYDRGVHDRDAAAILTIIGPLAVQAGALLTDGDDRAEAQLAWATAEDSVCNRWLERGAAVAELDVDQETQLALAEELSEELDLSLRQSRFLLEELSTGEPLAFAISTEAMDVVEHMARQDEVTVVLKNLGDDREGARSVLHDFVARSNEGREHLVNEVTVALLTPGTNRRSVEVDLGFTVDGLLGRHESFDGDALVGRVDRLLKEVDHHKTSVLPSHTKFAELRRKTIDDLRRTLRVEDLQPKVPDGFVRNQLIDKVYLPLIGDNLARQIGTVDDAAGARSGLLMLLSPPGYGKTTLVEYVADRLGMALVKISGPGLGHEVTSLDPAQAPSATAAREIERINLAFALGSNVMLYLDDIQHTSPELLQRFISLCDGQRRIEGVWNGEARTFDLRGKRFAVVMAGNPYTESGQRFQVPDMLANRADTYNLGDVLAGNDALFASSYLENSITSNKVTAPLSGREPEDFRLLVRAAQGHPIGDADLQHSYSTAERNEIVSLLSHFLRAQEVVLAVNRQYIASAATDDNYRTEPPFLLQGSYRNMVRIASRLLPAMTGAEVDRIVDEHYVAESQALTASAEANLLKLGELRGLLDDELQARWDNILTTFRRNQRLGGDESDPVTRVVAAIDSIGTALRDSQL